MTGTVGLVAALLGATSVVSGWNKDLLPVMGVIDIIILVLFFVAPFRFCSKHLYGRLQYYGELSQVTSEHMGLGTPYLEDPRRHVWHASSHVQALKRRALTHEKRIANAITTLFEARLYVSRCIRHGGDDENTRKEKLLKIYQATPDIVSASAGVYVRPVFFSKRFARIFRWMYVDVLLIGYRQNKASIGEERAALLFPDC